jgi:hypothetical protein
MGFIVTLYRRILFSRFICDFLPNNQSNFFVITSIFFLLVTICSFQLSFYLIGFPDIILYIYNIVTTLVQPAIYNDILKNNGCVVNRLRPKKICVLEDGRMTETCSAVKLNK